MVPNKNITPEQLTGRSLRDALSELDDKQIVSLFQQLIEEREAMIKRQEHLVSLSRLSEKTIAAADEVAMQIKEEAKNQAETQANAILDEARTSAQRLIEESHTQTVATVRSSLLAARTKYMTEFEDFSGKCVSEFKARTLAAVESVTSSLNACNSALKDQIVIFKKELDSRLSELEVTAFPEQAESVPVIPIADLPPPPDFDLPPGHEIRIVEILAPRDKERIDSVRAHLDMLNDVIETNIRHLVDRTLIEVTLLKPIDLTRIMADWPEVEMVQDLIVEGKPGTQVMLGVETEIAEERDFLNHKINRIAHRIKPLN